MAKYILLDDAMRIFSNVHTDNNVNPSVYRLIINDLNSLPSINPEEIIEEMQKQNKSSFDYYTDKLVWPARDKTLEELLQKFKS